MYSQELVQDILNGLLKNPENEVVEFKLASDNYDSRKLGKYFSALANETNLKGKQFGWLIFGIDDKTRKIKGSNYRNNRAELDSLKGEVANKTTNRITFIEIYELKFSEGRVVMFQIPGCPKGIPIAYDGHYYGRDGEELSALNLEEIERIRNQKKEDDWSIKIAEGATFNDLEPKAIQLARVKFKEKHKGNPLYEDIDNWSDETFLDKAKVTVNGRITNTAIILLGKPESTRFISPNIAEITWKLDTTDDKSYEHFGPPFLLTTTFVLQKIRNPKIKLFPKNELIATEVFKYETRVILEALHNCIAHQDYSKYARIILTEKGDRLIFENAGHFYEGTPNDYVDGEKTPIRYRNEWLAKAMVNLGMIDTMGYGIHSMYQTQRNRFFPLPDYSGSSSDKVVLQVHGHIIDEKYTRTLMEKKDLPLSLVVCLDRIQKGYTVTEDAIKELKRLKIIQWKNPYYIISEPIAHATGSVAKYIKNRGFDNEWYRKMILDFIKIKKSANRRDIEELLDNKLPDMLTPQQKFEKVSSLLKSLRQAKKITNIGTDTKPNWVLIESKND